MSNINNSKVNTNNETCLTFKEMMSELETRPKVKYLWSGIKENTFGLVFGPSKSGKTIFCENLAIKIAIGAKDYFGFPLEGIPKKTLFIGLEEDFISRGQRNKSQYEALNSEQQDLMEINYLYQPIEYHKRIVRNEDWESLYKLILKSKAKLVVIDSITRMNLGQLENSRDAEIMMQKLREICYNLGITLICVHHTPKMYDCPITMDKIKGSSVFAQESDFAIGINRTCKDYRYMKNVFFRYAPDDDDTVKEFAINNDLWLDFTKDNNEDEILNRSDRRRKEDKRATIIEFLDKNASTSYPTNELVNILKDELSLKDRRIKDYLKELTENQKINNVSYGSYASINYNLSNKDEEKEL